MIEENSVKAELSLYYNLYLPTQVRPPLLIVLHGYGGNKSQMMREALKFTPPEFAIVAMQGVHQHQKPPKRDGGPLRTGFGWGSGFHQDESITLHHKALLEICDRLVQQDLADPEAIFLAGFSQPVSLNYRFAFRHPDKLRGVIGICGGLPGDWEEGNYLNSNTSIFHLCGSDDPYYSPAHSSQHAALLRQRSSNVVLKMYESGHEITPEMREDIRLWLKEHCRRSA